MKKGQRGEDEEKVGTGGEGRREGGTGEGRYTPTGKSWILHCNLTTSYVVIA
jgi:hypothetical protein